MLKKSININKVYNKVVDRKVVSNLQKLGNEVITDVIVRTQHGKDINNRAFKKYSPSYKKAKAKSFGTKVNLTRTGKMLNSITWKKIRNGIRVYIASKAERDKAVGNQKTRKFMGLDRRQKERIANRIGEL